MSEKVKALYEKIFALREKQANCTVDERPAIEKVITGLFAEIKRSQ